MRFRRELPLILAALWMTAGGCSEPLLDPLPLPDTGRMEPEVRRQLDERRRDLEALAADRGSAEELAEAVGQMGRLYHAYDLTAAAAACYQNARRLAPEEFRWVYLLGLVQQTRGDLEAAAEALSSALAMRSDDVPTLARLGRGAHAAGR